MRFPVRLLSKALACAVLTLPLFLSPNPAKAAVDSRTVYDPTFFEPTEAVVTPHIPWADAGIQKT